VSSSVNRIAGPPRILDVDEAVERHPQDANRLLAVDDRDDLCPAVALEGAERARAAHVEDAARDDRDDDENQEEKRDDAAQAHRARMPRAAARLGGMGLFDWYWLGVGAGLGVAGGTAAGWIQAVGLRVLGTLAFVFAALVGIFVSFFVAAWGPAIWAGAATLAWVALRRLGGAAFPAAFLAAAVLSFVPFLGYVEAALAPVVGGRLRRRADAKYAGLRVLAKD
jgi:hypothetical protein